MFLHASGPGKIVKNEKCYCLTRTIDDQVTIGPKLFEIAKI